MTEQLLKVRKVQVRMYKMGTGDCFIVKFHLSDSSDFNLMIDAGTWSGSKAYLEPFVEDLKSFVNNKVDLLVITHEHKDHVHAFDVCRDLFLQNFTVDQVWLGWSENDSEKEVSTWKKSYGDKKKALASATLKLHAALQNQIHQNQLKSEFGGDALVKAEKDFTDSLDDFSKLHFEAKAGEYIGPLQGMKFIKENLINENVRYLKAGNIIEGLANLPGIKFYVLGPPILWDEVKLLKGNKKGDTYEHNKELARHDAFAAAVTSSNDIKINNSPFSSKYLIYKDKYPLLANYEEENQSWRKIDYDWLNTAGSLALRINSITNNLSVALAIELEESGRVLLFPGDAEWGSWDSWHSISWINEKKYDDKKVSFTTDLLNRTVFYKVAHHLSHNGTALNKGMKLMTNPELVAMATLDYNIISSHWMSTMPNEGLIKDLLAHTKGRLLVMNPEGVFADAKKTILLSEAINKARQKMNQEECEAFAKAVLQEDLFIQFTMEL